MATTIIQMHALGFIAGFSIFYRFIVGTGEVEWGWVRVDSTRWSTEIINNIIKLTNQDYMKIKAKCLDLGERVETKFFKFRR